MSRLTVILVFPLLFFSAKAQDTTRYKWIITTQYAGSTGLASGGISVGSIRNRIEAGFLFGYLPERFGGPIQTFTLKFTYNPFRIKLFDNACWEPLQTGLFVTQYSGNTFSLRWEDKYPRGYYWWPRSIRQHVFLSTQVSLLHHKKHLDRTALYFEANTNDLYLYSYFPNMRSLRFYDIVFFGAGLKLYLK